MQKLIAIGLAIILLLTIGGVALADKPPVDEDSVGNPIYGGNGAPSGYHFTLNIIGVQNTKSADMVYEEGSGRSSIFVKLEGKTKIYLEDAGVLEDDVAFKDAFAVLDANGTDGIARFQLPNPGLDPYVIGGDMTNVDVMADYTIIARPLGKPDGFAIITTCAQLIDEPALMGMLPKAITKVIQNTQNPDLAYASVQPVPSAFTFRDTGKSKFENVTAYLLTIVFEIVIEVEEGVFETYYVRVPIFNDMLEGEYWQYDNNKLKHLQVRFYPCETNITYADAPYIP